jgi:cell division protein YceG involved in septum cleavage
MFSLFHSKPRTIKITALSLAEKETRKINRRPVAANAVANRLHDDIQRE